MNSASMTTSLLGASAICNRLRSAPAVLLSIPASTRSAGRASKASTSSCAKTARSSEEVQSEVDRYCSWPGQACGYKVGHNTINRLREGAQSALGARYDFAAFNDAVVGGGNVPMTVLGRVIDAYVTGARG